MAVSKSDIKFYLTSLEPEIAQTNNSQSIGGYISTSTVYPNTTLSSALGLSGKSLTLASTTNFSGLTHLGINAEILKTEAIASTTVAVKERAVTQATNFHASSDLVYGLTLDGFFDQKFNTDFKQYRCIGIKNEHATDRALNVAVYLKQNTVNLSSVVKMAVEMPSNDYKSSTATGGSSISLIDSSLAGTFSDDHFADAVLRMTGGSNINQSRIVTSYDSGGTFVLQSSLPFSVSSGDSYEVDAGPAQRLGSSLDTPAFGSTRVTALSEADLAQSFIIDVSGSRTNGDDLFPNDVIYVWLERTLIKGSKQFDSNNAVLTVNYFTA